MMRRRPFRPPKKPVFFGCEGESEVAYGQILNDHLRATALPVHLHVDVLTPGAGDPLARVQRAIKRIAERERRRAKYRMKAILMDSDQAANDPARAERAKRLAAQHNMTIIWQDPCHEALLLRHMPNCSNLRPPSCVLAEQRLKAEWPEYEKPMPRARLAKRIDLGAIQRVPNRNCVRFWSRLVCCRDRTHSRRREHP